MALSIPQTLGRVITGLRGVREHEVPESEFFHTEVSHDPKPIHIERFGEVYRVGGGFLLDEVQARKLSDYEQIQGLSISNQRKLKGGFVFIPTGARKAKT